MFCRSKLHFWVGHPSLFWPCPSGFNFVWLLVFDYFKYHGSPWFSSHRQNWCFTHRSWHYMGWSLFFYCWAFSGNDHPCNSICGYFSQSDFRFWSYQKMGSAAWVGCIDQEELYYPGRWPPASEGFGISLPFWGRRFCPWKCVRYTWLSSECSSPTICYSVRTVTMIHSRHPSKFGYRQLRW